MFQTKLGTIFGILFVFSLLSYVTFANPFNIDQGFTILLEIPLGPEISATLDYLGSMSIMSSSQMPIICLATLFFSIAGMYLIYKYSNRKVEDLIDPYSTSETFYEVEQKSRPNTLKRIISRWNKNRIDVGIGVFEAARDLLISIPSLAYYSLKFLGGFALWNINILRIGGTFLSNSPKLLTDKRYREDVCTKVTQGIVSLVKEIADFVGNLFGSFINYYVHDADKHPFRGVGRALFDLGTILISRKPNVAGRTGRAGQIASEASQVGEIGRGLNIGKSITILGKVVGVVKTWKEMIVKKATEILEKNRWGIDLGHKFFPVPHLHMPPTDIIFKAVIGYPLYYLGKKILPNVGEEAMKCGVRRIESAISSVFHSHVTFESIKNLIKEGPAKVLKSGLESVKSITAAAINRGINIENVKSVSWRFVRGVSDFSFGAFMKGLGGLVRGVGNYFSHLLNGLGVWEWYKDKLRGSNVSQQNSTATQIYQHASRRGNITRNNFKYGGVNELKFYKNSQRGLHSTGIKFFGVSKSRGGNSIPKSFISTQKHEMRYNKKFVANRQFVTTPTSSVRRRVAVNSNQSRGTTLFRTFNSHGLKASLNVYAHNYVDNKTKMRPASSRSKESSRYKSLSPSYGRPSGKTNQNTYHITKQKSSTSPKSLSCSVSVRTSRSPMALRKKF